MNFSIALLDFSTELINREKWESEATDKFNTPEKTGTCLENMTGRDEKTIKNAAVHLNEEEEGFGD